MNELEIVPLITWGVLHVRLPSREKLRKTLVAFELPPPGPWGRSFQTAYSVPLASIVLLGASKRRESWPGLVWITSSGAKPQLSIVSPAPWTRAMAVTARTDALLTS